MYIGLIVELHPFNLFLAFNFFLILDVVPSFQVDTLISRALCEFFSRGAWDNNAWLPFTSLYRSKIRATLLASF